MKKYLAIAAVAAAFSFSAPAHAQGTFQCTASNSVKSYNGAFSADAKKAQRSALLRCYQFSRPGTCRITGCIG